MRSPDVLTITVEPLEEARLIRVAGELDLLTTPTLGRELHAARDQGVTAVLDLSDVTFIDSTGLQLLLEASSLSAANGWAFFIARPSAVVQRLVDVSRTAELLPLVEPAATRVLA
jgi:anti-sigma B factor antagonist